MNKSILWIEDAAYDDLSMLASYFLVETDYDLRIATDVTKAVADIKNCQFDVLIVDFKIPPGDNDEWQDLYYKLGGSLKESNLGLHLLHSLFRSDSALVVIPELPNWVSPSKCGVLTIEPNRSYELKALGIMNYLLKNNDLTEKTLVELVKRVLSADPHSDKQKQ